MPSRLVDRAPVVAPEALIAGLRPPPLFAGAQLDGYHPDPAQPSQSAAVAAVRTFAETLWVEPPVTTPARWGRRGRAGVGGRGIYLDGGFGVGKTHLLAALWHAAPAPKAYLTFVELTHLAGAVGFSGLVEALAAMRLVAIDEFELDDPGDTVLVSSLLGRLAERGVALAATSNTVPDRLGERRFATSDFLREIQSLAARFDTVRIDGPDFRHRSQAPVAIPSSEAQVRAQAESTPGASLDSFPDLMAHLAALHPVRYGALVEETTAVHLTYVTPVPNQDVALRLVVLADRLYDRQLPVFAAGSPLTDVFGDDMLAGGYRKKYLRAISRLAALTRSEVCDGSST